MASKNYKTCKNLCSSVHSSNSKIRAITQCIISQNNKKTAQGQPDGVRNSHNRLNSSINGTLKAQTQTTGLKNTSTRLNCSTRTSNQQPNRRTRWWKSLIFLIARHMSPCSTDWTEELRKAAPKSPCFNIPLCSSLEGNPKILKP